MTDTTSTSATTVIVGPGALGRLLAFHLSSHRSLHSPVLLVGRRRASEHHTLITPDGEARQQRLNNCMASQLSQQQMSNIEAVHLTTKTYATQAALDSISALVPPATPLVLWQNGFTVQPSISASWPGPVLCASTTEGAYINDKADNDKAAQQCIVHAGRGHTVIGDLDNTHSELATRIARRLDAAGMRAEPVPDIRVRLWHKLAVNAAINPLVARYRIRNGQLRDRPFRPMVMTLVDEIQAIVAAEGIAAPAPGWPTLVWGVIQATANNRASMLQDVLADRPTEHTAILGPLCDAAAHHGIAAPQLEAQLRWLSSR